MQTIPDKTPSSPLVLATSIEEALSILKSAGPDAALLAGGTWLMRAKARQEVAKPVLVSLSRIQELHAIKIDDDLVSIGSMVTHSSLSQALVDMQDLAGLYQAAKNSANPAVRNMATIGGNICTTGFAAADLLPVLLSLDATIELQSLSGPRKISLADFVLSGRQSPYDEILTYIHIPRSSRFSSHSRMLLRKAGEYPVANLSLCTGFNADGVINHARIVVGSVENQPKYWTGLETALIGESIAETDVKALAKAHLDEFHGRDGADAPGWYRKKVMSVLAARAFESAVSEYDRSIT